MQKWCLLIYSPDSSQYWFWEQQLNAASCKDARGMRWHPLMIRWCLYLRHQSSSANETLRESGVLHLPSQRTLRDYSHHTKARTGFSHEVDQQLMDAANVQTSEEWQKCVILLFDEMHIREDFIFDKNTGAVIANLGEINNQLLEFERSLEAMACTESLATSMTVLPGPPREFFPRFPAQERRDAREPRCPQILPQHTSPPSC